MSYATLAYIPPARLHADAFLRNLGAFNHEYPIIFYSDHPQENIITVPIPDPTSIKLSKNRVAIHNRIFLHGLEIAQKQGIKRFIYLESDCRVGHDYWDKRVFEEAEPYKDMFCAGTPAIYNYTAATPKQKLSYIAREGEYKNKTGFDIPHFNARRTRPMSAMFNMGAGAVYPVAITADLFMGFERDAHQKAIRVPAFDLFIGMRCFQLFGNSSINKLPFLTSVFSTFGDRINTEKDRIEMVRSGKYSIVHQIKTNEDCL